MTFPWRRRLFISAALMSILAGCAHDEDARPLTPAMLGAPRTERPIASDPLSHTDQPGLLPNDRRGDGNVRRGANQHEPVEGLSQVVLDNVKPPGPGEEFPRQPATRAATGPTTIGVSTGQYYDIGGVVMDVDGTPIYANKVLSLLEPVFAAKAKGLSANQFRPIAEHEIDLQVRALCQEELYYTAADRFLDKKEKDMADALTMQWRNKQINAAGGSLEVARQRAAARGENFDELVHEQYRTWMIAIYKEQKIMSKIQISAAEIREYYEHNLDREFTTHASARFRLIKVDKSRHGGPDEALKLLTSLRDRIVKAGESFDAIARSVNDDPRLLKSGGDLGTPIEQHAFAISSVDDAVWETPAGDVTPIVDVGNALYIAKVEEKNPALVQPYDEAIQARINYILSNTQFREASEATFEKLKKEAAVFMPPGGMNTALEMAMQNYPRWAGK